MATGTSEMIGLTFWLPGSVVLAEKSCVAWLQKRPATESYTETEFIIEAVSREVERLRRKHAKELPGGVFPPTMKIRKGRPPGV